MTEQPTTAADPRDAMTVQRIARNIVDEFPTFHERRQLLISEIAGALGHERQSAEARQQDGSALRTAARDLVNSLVTMDAQTSAVATDKLVALTEALAGEREAGEVK